MTQLTDDCFAFDGPRMTTAEALALLAERVGPAVPLETIAITDAVGRILATDVTSDRNVPPHDNSAVDGYAVAFEDLNPDAETRLPVTGRVAAGHRLDRPTRPGEAIRIFTGAPMPDGADTVMMQEDCRRVGDCVIVTPGIKRGANRRRAGEDVKAGAVVLRQGVRLRPQDVGLTASIGYSRIEVYQRLRAAIFSTGDELREPGEDLPAGCIYDANRITLKALLEGLGCTVTDLGILPDNLDAITRALREATSGHDLIATSGGMSVGEEDHVKAAVERSGRLYFWRLSIKPGRPIALGQIESVPFVGLPGNPVAMMVTFLCIARPMILRLAGCTELSPRLFRVRSSFSYSKKQGRREWIRAHLVREADGSLSAVKFPRGGAGILSSMVEADGLVELAEDRADLATGTMVDFLPFHEVGL